MNSAGLPGTGLGGFLYLALALSMPFRELYLTLRGRSSRDRWKVVARQFAIACGILAGVESSFWLLARVGVLPQVGTGVFLVAPMALSLSMLLAVLTVLWAWAQVVRLHGRTARRVVGGGPELVVDALPVTVEGAVPASDVPGRA